MRPVVTLLFAAGCGRISFDAQGATDGAPVASDSFASTCAFERIVTIDHGGASDTAVGTLVADSIVAACGTAPARRGVSQDDPGVLAANGRPLTPPDELVVIGGGDGPNRAIAYLLEGDTALVWSSPTPSDATIRERATGRTIADGNITGRHDYAFMFVVREPIGGGLVVSAQGFATRGTVAAGHWFAKVLASELATSSDAWAVVEWTDLDTDPDPSDGDAFTELARGR